MAIQMMPDINKFLRQRITEPMRMEQTLVILKDLMRNVDL
jgi:flagellar biosynthesis/type III secretory pathway ATPase